MDLQPSLKLEPVDLRLAVKLRFTLMFLSVSVKPSCSEVRILMGLCACREWPLLRQEIEAFQIPALSNALQNSPDFR